MTNQPLNICVLAEANGDHTYVQCEILKERGHSVTLVSPNSGKCPPGIRHIDCSVENSRGVLSKIKWIKKVYSGVRSVKADVYHAHYAAELTTWMAWLLRKKPLVISCLGGDVLFDEQGSQSALRRWMTRQALKSCDHVTAVSNFLGSKVHEMGVPNPRISRVIWGVNTNIFYPLGQKGLFREKWEISTDAPLIFSPRQMKKFYNQQFMVESLSEIVKELPNCILALSTYNQEEDFKAELETRIQVLGLEKNIRFIDPMNQQEMMQAYNDADVLLSLPPSDGTPVSVMESMACGTPVVMTNLERFKEFFTHKETAWFTSIEKDAIVQGLLQVLTDKPLYEKLKSKGIELICSQADLQSQTSLLEEISYRLVEKNNRL